MNKEMVICAIENNLDKMYLDSNSWSRQIMGLNSHLDLDLKAVKEPKFKDVTLTEKYKNFWGRIKEKEVVKVHEDGFRYYVEFWKGKTYRYNITEDEFDRLIKLKKEFDLVQVELELKKLCNKK
tara:strand:+ start:308 stop:679 length:372 start_codon:yes stop_codon:yes gene_type:complete